METADIPVLSIGYLVPQGVQGAQQFGVHSCFEHALNLLWPDGALCTLLSQSAQNLPLAIRLATPARWDWRVYARRDEVIRCNGDVLQGPHWQANLKGAFCWRPVPRPVNPGSTAFSNAVQMHDLIAGQLQQYGQQQAVHSHLQLLPGWPDTGLVPQLSIQLAPSVLQEQVLRLIGFGSGLTPDGDDYLLGYLAALQAWPQSPAIAEHCNVLSQLIRNNLDRTNDISRHYLILALQGHYSQSINELIDALIFGHETNAVLAAAMQVMQFGAASGVDALAGFLHGIRTLKAVLA